VCFFFFHSAFSLNAKGLPETENSLSFQKIVFVLKVVCSKSKERGNMERKVTQKKLKWEESNQQT
jgi:hypothetical protein